MDKKQETFRITFMLSNGCSKVLKENGVVKRCTQADLDVYTDNIRMYKRAAFTPDLDIFAFNGKLLSDLYDEVVWVDCIAIEPYDSSTSIDGILI